MLSCTNHIAYIALWSMMKDIQHIRKCHVNSSERLISLQSFEGAAGDVQKCWLIGSMFSMLWQVRGAKNFEIMSRINEALELSMLVSPEQRAMYNQQRPQSVLAVEFLFLFSVFSWISAVIMVALWNRADHYIFILFLSFFSSPNLSGRRLDVYHTSTHGVALVRI